MRVWCRENLALGLVLLAGLVLFFALEARSQKELTPLQPSVYDEHLTFLEREAIDRAYQKYVEQQFESWMRDPESQPWRAVEGTRKARRAYIEVMTAIDARGSPTRELKK